MADHSLQFVRPSYSGNTSAFQADAVGSIPTGRSILGESPSGMAPVLGAGIMGVRFPLPRPSWVGSSMVEQQAFNLLVASSSPARPTIYLADDMQEFVGVV